MAFIARGISSALGFGRQEADERQQRAPDPLGSVEKKIQSMLSNYATGFAAEKAAVVAKTQLELANPEAEDSIVHILKSIQGHFIDWLEISCEVDAAKFQRKVVASGIKADLHGRLQKVMNAYGTQFDQLMPRIQEDNKKFEKQIGKEVKKEVKKTEKEAKKTEKERKKAEKEEKKAKEKEAKKRKEEKRKARKRGEVVSSSDDEASSDATSPTSMSLSTSPTEGTATFHVYARLIRFLSVLQDWMKDTQGEIDLLQDVPDPVPVASGSGGGSGGSSGGSSSGGAGAVVSPNEIVTIGGGNSPRSNAPPEAVAVQAPPSPLASKSSRTRRALFTATPQGSPSSGSSSSSPSPPSS